MRAFQTGVVERSRAIQVFSTKEPANNKPVMEALLQRPFVTAP